MATRNIGGVLKLYGTGSATANAVAQVVLPSKGHIIGVQVSMRGTSIVASSSVDCEVSRVSAREIQVNASQQCVCQVTLATNFVTSGLSQAGVNQFFPVSVPIVQGQIIYLHAFINGTMTYDFTGLIFWA